MHSFRGLLGACLVAGPMLACAGGDMDEGRGTATGSGGSDNGTGAGDTTKGNFGNSGGTSADATQGSGNGPGTAGGDAFVTGSYIWIANSGQGTVSKLDTRTVTELARYQTSPGGQGLPSRTSVGASGDMVVANRGYATDLPTAEGGGVMKVYATMEDCAKNDLNGDGIVQTSTGAMDVLPWGSDECVAWYTDIPEASNRPVQWANPATPDGPAKVWTAGANQCNSGECNITVYRLNGDTGAVEDTVPIMVPPGPDFITGMAPTQWFTPMSGFIDNYGPYGAAADAGGHLWVFNGNTTHLIRIDANNLEVKHWPVPMANGYGITIDTSGRILLCGPRGLSRFDPATAMWATAASPVGGVEVGHNGCMTDGKVGNETLWVGGGSDLGTPGLHAFGVESLMLIDTFEVGTVKGVSIDHDGFVWGVSSAGAFGGNPDNVARRLDPATGDVMEYMGLTGTYSYSDMTGVGLAVAGYVVPKLD